MCFRLKLNAEFFIAELVKSKKATCFNKKKNALKKLFYVWPYLLFGQQFRYVILLHLNTLIWLCTFQVPERSKYLYQKYPLWKRLRLLMLWFDDLAFVFYRPEKSSHKSKSFVKEVYTSESFKNKARLRSDVITGSLSCCILHTKKMK